MCFFVSLPVYLQYFCICIQPFLRVNSTIHFEQFCTFVQKNCNWTSSFQFNYIKLQISSTQNLQFFCNIMQTKCIWKYYFCNFLQIVADRNIFLVHMQNNCNFKLRSLLPLLNFFEFDPCHNFLLFWFYVPCPHEILSAVYGCFRSDYQRFLHKSFNNQNTYVLYQFLLNFDRFSWTKNGERRPQTYS